MKVQGKKDLDFVDYAYLSSPLNMQWCTLKDQMTIVTVMDVKIFCLLCKAYVEDLLPTLEIDNMKIMLEMSTYFIHEFGKIEQASYLSSQCAAALCHMLNKLDSMEDFDSVKDIYSLTLKTVLNIPKVMLQKDVQQPWTTPTKTTARRSLQLAYISMVECFHKLKHIELEHFTDLHYTGMSLVLSLYIQPGQQLNFTDFQYFITENREKESERDFIVAFSSFYNMKTSEEDDLDRKFTIVQHEQYLDSLCQIILNEVTPKKFVELFSQILVNEFIFTKTTELQSILDLGMSDIYQRVLEKQLQQSTLK